MFYILNVYVEGTVNCAMPTEQDVVYLFARDGI